MATFPIEPDCQVVAAGKTPPAIVLINVLMEDIDTQLEDCGCKSKRIRNRIYKRVEKCVNGNLGNQRGMQDGIQQIIGEEFGRLQEQAKSSQEEESEVAVVDENARRDQIERDGSANRTVSNPPMPPEQPDLARPNGVVGGEPLGEPEREQSRGQFVADNAHLQTVRRVIQEDISRGERVLNELARMQEQAERNPGATLTEDDLRRLLGGLLPQSFRDTQDQRPGATSPPIVPRIFDNIDGSILPSRSPLSSLQSPAVPQVQPIQQAEVNRIVAIENECGVPICNLHLHFHFNENGLTATVDTGVVKSVIPNNFPVSNLPQVADSEI